jgi:S1-C subfamily serine protease
MFRRRKLSTTSTRCLLALLVGVGVYCSAVLPAHAVDQIPTGTPVETDTAGKSRGVAVSSVVRVVCSAEGTGGSGFLHRSGKIISAAHVVADCDKAKLLLVLGSGKRLEVSEVKYNETLDLALLTPKEKISGPSLPISSTPKLAVGSQVTTWGYPAGYNGAAPLLSVGYLAGEDRVKTKAGLSPPRWVVNAAFNGGNSGGPLVNIEDGSVIGVVSSKLAPISPLIESALEVLKKQRSGFTYTKQYPDGTTETVSEGQVVAEVLYYLRTQTQLVVGHAIKSDDVRSFLKANSVEP